jgi:RimJ/RimL family protein N-acetyltransferase
MSDAGNFVRHLNNRKITRNLYSIPYPYTMAEAKKWLRKNLRKNKDSRRKINRAIVVDNEVAGSIGGEIHEKGHKMSFGYWLAEKHWGNKIMSEAVNLFTDYVFRKKKIVRMEAEVYPHNKASMRILEKNGFKLEGVLRKNVKKNGKVLDSYLFSKVK